MMKTEVFVWGPVECQNSDQNQTIKKAARPVLRPLLLVFTLKKHEERLCAGSGDENARLGGWRVALRQSVKRIRPSEDPLTGRNKRKDRVK